MKIKERSNTERTKLVEWLATHWALAVGLWIGALGIFLQTATSAKGHPKVPLGILILAAVGLFVYLTSRWAWTALIGFFPAALISMGSLRILAAYRLQHPKEIGLLIGNLVQLIGAGTECRHHNHRRAVLSFESEPKRSTRLTAVSSV